MKRIPLTYLTASAAVFAALLLPVSAFAQYVWIDDRGVKQYSDMPPPPSVPANRILKHPGARPAQPAAAENSGTPATSAAKADLTTAERNTEFRKRKLEQAEKDKKAADEAQMATDKAKNCERAKDYQRSLESGERISRTDRNGERSFLTDEQRARELHETRRMLDDCK